MNAEDEAREASISPLLSLELRIRWLEALVLGVHPEPRDRLALAAAAGTSDKQTLIRRTEDITAALGAIVKSNDGLRKFMDQYETHAHLLLAPAAPAPAMSSAELDALLAEMEPDIRAADADVRAILALEASGATAAGRLAEHEPLQARLAALCAAHEEDRALAAALEARVGALLRRYTLQVDALSELFVEWNAALAEAEDGVARQEKARAERLKLGLD